MIASALTRTDRTVKVSDHGARSRTDRREQIQTEVGYELQVSVFCRGSDVLDSVFEAPLKRTVKLQLIRLPGRRQHPGDWDYTLG